MSLYKIWNGAIYRLYGQQKTAFVRRLIPVRCAGLIALWTLATKAIMCYNNSMTKTINCGCGCGETLTEIDNHGRKRKYKHGHYSRVNNPGLDKANAMPKKPVGTYWRDSTHWRTCRARARSIIDTSKCEWEHIGHCKGNIHVAHVSGDYTNNDKSNLKALCASHHRLLDNGKIDPLKPKMPPFRTGIDGKRRYL